MNIYGGTLAEGTKKTYMSNLKKLNNKVDPTDIKFLKKTDIVLEKIKEIVNPNTRRTYYISVVTALKDQPKYKKEYDIYHAEMMNINKELNTDSFKSEKTKEKHIKVDMVVLHKRQDYLNEVITQIGKKRKITDEQYNKLHDLVIVSLYMLIAPRRVLDYSCMVVEKPTDNKELNYYNDGKFYFNNYKTKGSYNQQMVEVPKNLQDILKVWLKLKRGEDNHLLLTLSSQPLKANKPYSPSDLSKYIKVAFDNPSMGISVLRGEYLKDKYGTITKEMKEDIKNMGTSMTVATETYIKE
jgi:hypothetical protein